MEQERREAFDDAVDAQARDLATEIVRDPQRMGALVTCGDLLPHEFMFHHPRLGRLATLEEEFLRLLAAHMGPEQDAVIAALAQRSDVQELAWATVLGRNHGEEPQ